MNPPSPKGYKLNKEGWYPNCVGCIWREDGTAWCSGNPNGIECGPRGTDTKPHPNCYEQAKASIDLNQKGFD